MDRLTDEAFVAFLRAYPPGASVRPVADPAGFAELVAQTLGSRPPRRLVQLWGTVGVGPFADSAVCFLGPEDRSCGRSLIEWNQDAAWLEIYPPARAGGPVFVAETCFGDQLGYRHEAGATLAVLFAMDTFEGFVIARDFDALFDNVLSDPTALVDQERLSAAQRALGPCRPGSHFAPIVSPLFGGSADANNLSVQEATVHLRTALADFKGARDAD